MCLNRGCRAHVSDTCTAPHPERCYNIITVKDRKRLEMEKRVALWDAINEYVLACGGDPSKHIGATREKAVVKVERVVFSDVP